MSSTAAALALVLGGQAAAAAPAGLAASVAGAVAASGLPGVATAGLVSLMSMKTTVAAATVAVVLAGGVATRQVMAAREAAAALAAVEGENAALAEQLRAERERLASAGKQPPAAKEAVELRPVTRPPTETGGLASREEGRALLAAHPELREELETYYRATLRVEFAELIAALGLTSEETERFLGILIRSRTKIVGEHQLTLSEPGLTGEEATRQLRELLGGARYQEYRKHRAGSVPRALATKITEAVYFTPTPVTPAQADQLKQIVVHALADPSLGSSYKGSSWMPIPEKRWEQIIAKSREVLPEAHVAALENLRERSRFYHAEAAARKAYDEAATRVGRQ